MRIGIIGTGNMGSMLAKGLSNNEQVSTIYLYNRTPAKAEELCSTSPVMHLCKSLHRLISNVDFVLLCTKAEDGRTILRQIGDQLNASQFLVTTISTIPLVELEQQTRAKIIKLIPSLTQTVAKGIALLTFSSRLTTNDCQLVSNLFATFANPFPISESQIRVSSDLTSCGPAFLSYIALAWCAAAANTEVVSFDVAERMIRETIVGWAGMLESGMTFKDIVTKVTVPGGITARGIGSLGDAPYQMFEALHQATVSVQHHNHMHKVPEHQLFHQGD